MTQATSPTSTSDSSLPQYGFGAQIAFDALIDTNPFLFRVYTPKHSTSTSDSTSDDSDAHFLAQQFENDPLAPSSKPSPATYADVANHMDWTTKSTSPFVSTSFSFAWALWEAVRRYHGNMKHDVEIAVIDARLVADRAVTAVELLRNSKAKERHTDHWKWYRFALESQSVLVHHSIPRKAVFSSIPLLKLLEKLPSYLTTTSETDKTSPFDQLSWDYTQRKQMFKQFCQDAAERFLKMPVEKRLRDTTTSAVRLSLSFLRPWLHRVSLDDVESAQTALTSLAIVVGRWPGQLWVRDHSEVAELSKAMVEIVLEEMRESQKTQKAADAEKMQGIVDQIRRLSLECEKEISRRRLLEAVTPSLVSSAPVDEGEVEKEEIPVPHTSSSYRYRMVDQQALIGRVTASTWFTGFVFGSFVTLCLLSHQRRELLYCT